MSAKTDNAKIILKAEHLQKVYPLGRKEVVVLKDASLEVREGEAVAIIGASGSGKSTLLHILGGLDQPSGGQVWFQDRDLYAMSARARTRVRARHIGFVFQAYYLLPELDVMENVMLPALNSAVGFWRCFMGKGSAAGLDQAVEDRSARARGLLRAVGLDHRADHLPMELSGGEQQRAALARALMNQPDIILADEPTGNLDPVTGEQVLEGLFGLVRGQGHTLVIVTHNPAVAARCDRTLELKDGGLVFF